ncbi:hypothetical protein O181_055298 [Austropuccinia psidii MF-1]|uniref:Uncharacterized protein n=1 Tax=Austropuccinia psidii MF-1 TaxID=1389203 RepID=A0A9Q3E7M2_9BASI|nr:hypothetical protein [Austropuccinia psidii MF-1]
MWQANKVSAIPSGARWVARCFSAAKNSTERSRAQVARASINSPWAWVVPAPRRGVTASVPGKSACTYANSPPIEAANCASTYSKKRVGDIAPMRSNVNETFLSKQKYNYPKRKGNSSRPLEPVLRESAVEFLRIECGPSSSKKNPSRKQQTQRH